MVFSGKGVNSRTKKQKANALSYPRNILAESAPKGGKKSKNPQAGHLTYLSPQFRESFIAGEL